nr:hypothetical protein [Tanacetum cinerariifolium]
KLKAAFEEFKRYEDDRVEQRCAKLDACLDALSIDFDEELYPHMLTAIAGRRWAYEPEAEAKFVAALQSLKDLKFSLLDQLEGLKDAPMDLTIPVYLDVRDPRNPWACKEEIALADAIAATISRAEKKMPNSMPNARGWLCTPC